MAIKNFTQMIIGSYICHDNKYSPLTYSQTLLALKNHSDSTYLDSLAEKHDISIFQMKLQNPLHGLMKLIF